MSSFSADLTGKVILVTGGSRGLGKSMVLAFAKAGADVIISSRKFDACEEVAKDVRKTTGRKALAYACHVANWDELERLADAAYDEFGKVDVLVNNAGMSPLYPSLIEVTEDLYDKVYGINAKGPFRLSAIIGTRMMEAKTGSIINVSSVGSLNPAAFITPYAGAKAALNAMTVGLADAFAPHVRVNVILPGPFRTDVTRDWSDEALEGSMAMLKRLGEPEEIIGAALFLASDASSYVTGAQIKVDGGVSRST